MKLSIVMPTIAGRELELERSIGAYERLTPVKIEWVIERGHPNCGSAWNAGVPKTTGEIVHIGADDIEPETDEWWPAAMSVIEQGRVPLGLVREDAEGGGYGGVFGRDFCRMVICRREWGLDVPQILYYSDNAWTDLMVQNGHEPTVAEGFDFYHRRSMVGRDDGPERVAADERSYQAWRSTSQS